MTVLDAFFNGQYVHTSANVISTVNCQVWLILKPVYAKKHLKLFCSFPTSPSAKQIVGGKLQSHVSFQQIKLIISFI